MRVLVVDDAAVARAVFARFAVAAGHEIVGESASVDDALERAADRAPDVVVIDGRLPPDGAAGLIARMRARWPVLRIVVVAALHERDLVRAATAAGASAALLRPYAPANVAAALGPA